MASLPDEPAHKRKHADYDHRCHEEKWDGEREGHGRAYTKEDTPPARCSILCGPRSSSALPSSLGIQNDGVEGTSPPEPKRRRLWVLRGLVKMFRRRVKRKGGIESSESLDTSAPTLRARSASELMMDPENRTNSGPYNQGLSVSHDSVFSPESPTEPSHTAPPGLSLATRGVNMSELKAALRRGRGLDSESMDDDLDDPGLSRSSKTSGSSHDVLHHGQQNSSRGAQSSCSDGSLLSMGSSENDDDSFDALSRHSSKYSLAESRCQAVDNEPAVGAAPLCHKAARHKMAVRPKKKHRLPRTKKQITPIPSGLPTTPEVNEDGTFPRMGATSNFTFGPSSECHERAKSPRVNVSSMESHLNNSETEDKKNARKSLTDQSYYTEKMMEDPTSHGFIPIQADLPKLPLDEFSRSPPAAFQDYRPSREKRKVPFRTPSGYKASRQTSDLSQLHDKDSLHVNEKDASHRSSSVEGRLEGNIVESSSQYHTQTEVNHKVVEESREVMTRTRNISSSYMSSSYDGLDYDGMIPEELKINKTYRASLESCEGAKSSTDSLTTTPLPGIYIRSNQSLTKLQRISMQHHVREGIDQQHPKYLDPRDNDMCGPLSLDSSLSAVQYESEELRKSVSVDEVGFGSKADWAHAYDATQSNSPAVRPPGTTNILRSLSVHSPTFSSRESSGRSRKSSIGDELESDSSLPKVALRKVKREPSIKSTVEEPQTGAVPEFMRIQLNRVQNKGNTVVFSTEQKNAVATSDKSAALKLESFEASPEPMKERETDETEKARDQSEIIVEENAQMPLSVKMDADRVMTNKPTELLNSVKTSPNSGSFAPAKTGPTKVKEEPMKRKEEIVLRRPSVVDRAIVIDQTMNALPSSPTPKKDGDEPELFKVFARRSFKLKDPEMDSTKLEEVCNDGDKENHIPKVVGSDNEIENAFNLNRKPEQCLTSNTNVNPSLPMLKSISAIRYSLGNPPPEYKPTVIVLSGKNVTMTELKASSFQEKEPGSFRASLYERSQSLSPSISETQRSAESGDISGLEDCSDLNSPNNSITRFGQRRSLPKESIKKGSSKTNITPENLLKKTAKPSIDRECVLKDNESTSSFNSSIIRRSNLSSLRAASETSDALSNDGSPLSSTPPQQKTKCQPVVWPPKYPPSDPPSSVVENSAVPESNPAPPRSGRPPFPHSNILSSFKEGTTPSRISSERTEVHSTNEEVISQEVKPGVVTPVEQRKNPAKEEVIERHPLPLAEAKNTTVTNSFESSPSTMVALSYLEKDEAQAKLERKISTEERRQSMGGSEDWRLLVKQRREDRMKQMKTPDAEEIIIETAPNMSRNSKVLEMASNFQKLQVA